MHQHDQPRAAPAACRSELTILWVGWAAAHLGRAYLGNLTDLDRTYSHCWGQLIEARAVHVSLIPCWDRRASPRMFFSRRQQMRKRTSPVIQMFFQTCGHVQPGNRTSHVPKPKTKGGGELWLLRGRNFKVTWQRAGTKG